MAQPAPTPRRGRRPAGQDTRADILAAAREEFVDRGYEASSLRSVARRAGVDPGTVRHWFPDKARLLTATLGVAGVEPDKVVEQVAGGPIETLGERLIEAVIGVWDFDGGETVRVVIPAVMSDAELRGLLPQFIGAAILNPVMRALDVPDAPLRTALVASQMAGVLLTRYLIPVEPLASLAPAQVARLVGPTLQRYLTGTLLDAETLAPGPGTSA
ncbi:TetR/AcrR family transcriptional regulator [Promicromonospora sp. AC04]|uniref:TetR/AcrR family transcriptional regulator n=1 Tax=Promicromonospora sp. AC04 TaxID=2135723 RepID=UPI000D3828C4|nr:TetR family transcriptional regulator [Promicromonospora sp. AC04]